MWHSDHEHTEEEIKVLRELEYDLFMYDLGFRTIWNNDFDAYFKSLFDEELWENKMEQAMNRASQDMSRQMLEDPEFAAFMKEQAIVEGVLTGELRPENAPVEMRQDLEALLNREQQWDELDETENPETGDALYITAKNWATNLSKKVGPLYEQFGNIELFRILTNCYIVPGKIIFAQDGMNLDIEGLGKQWQPDRIGYTLALTSLRRCVESLTSLQKNKKLVKLLGPQKLLNAAKKIQKELIDRLDEIEQQRLKN